MTPVAPGDPERALLTDISLPGIPESAMSFSERQFSESLFFFFFSPSLHGDLINKGVPRREAVGWLYRLLSSFIIGFLTRHGIFFYSSPHS